VQPVIGISAETREVATSSGAQPADSVTRTYTNAIRLAGGIPVLLPISEPEVIPELAGRLDGILLTGGGDVSPHRYDGQEHESIYGIDHTRDEFELELARHVAAERIPLLAICRGLQVLNVALGGTLYQDIGSQLGTGIEHFVSGDQATVAHQNIRFEEGCNLAGLFGLPGLMVNSLHHQAVLEAAPGLRPIAWSDDGVVEALEADDPEWPMIAVQWHPEHLTSNHDSARLLFEELITAAGKRRDRRFSVT
jgi:putative glutamine amidotransferase